MRKLLLSFMLFGTSLALWAQTIPTELQKLIISFTPAEGSVGSCAVGNPSAYDVKWAADKIEMSADTAINFYRNGMACS